MEALCSDKGALMSTKSLIKSIIKTDVTVHPFYGYEAASAQEATNINSLTLNPEPVQNLGDFWSWARSDMISLVWLEEM